MSESDKMTLNDYIKISDRIAILVALLLFLVVKFLKYRTSNEKLKLKKVLSHFNSIESPTLPEVMKESPSNTSK
jgi:hypothetical protein